jgi:GNAT superfamily N-acetyltransferase
MTLWRNLLKTALQGLRQWWRHPMRALQVKGESAEVLVPIVSMDERHKDKILTHLLQLSAQDRVLRFGYPATDEQIGRYVQGMNFQRDHIYGIFNVALRIEALAHLSIEQRKDGATLGEFGVSVRQKSRGKGLGNRLFERAMVHARHEGVSIFYIHALSENAPMLAIAKHHGATLERDGSETEAYLRLPPADLESELEDWVIDQYGRINYSVKEQVKSFVDAVSQVQEIRQAVREGRHQSAS